MVNSPLPLSNKPKQPVTWFSLKYFSRLLSSTILLGEQAASATITRNMAKRLLVIAKIFAKIVRGKITKTKKQDPKGGYMGQFLRRQKRFFINQQHEFM